MARIRNEPNRYWSQEEKLRIVKRVVDNALLSNEVAKDQNISRSMICKEGYCWDMKFVQRLGHCDIMTALKM